MEKLGNITTRIYNHFLENTQDKIEDDKNQTEIDQALILSLPDEIIFEIFRKLDNKSRLDSKLVCRSWNQILNDPLLKGSETENVYDAIEKVRLYLQYKPSLISLYISSMGRINEVASSVTILLNGKSVEASHSVSISSNGRLNEGSDSYDCKSMRERTEDEAFFNLDQYDAKLVQPYFSNNSALQPSFNFKGNSKNCSNYIYGITDNQKLTKNLFESILSKAIQMASNDAPSFKPSIFYAGSFDYEIHMLRQRDTFAKTTKPIKDLVEEDGLTDEFEEINPK